MRKLLLFIFILLFTASAFSQEYSFLPASKKVTFDEYASYLNKSGKGRDSIIKNIPRYRENGTRYIPTRTDSINNSKNRPEYVTLVFKDTVTGNFSFVMQKLTTSDLKNIKSYPQSDLDEDTKNRENLKGATIEALSLTDMNGTVHTLQSLKGKVIVLDFWYVKCSSCIAEMPELNKIREEYGTDNVGWFGITYDTKRKVEKFLQKTKFDFNLVPDSKKITDFFNIKYYPATFVLNTNGQIVYTGKNGAIAGRSKELRAILDEILGDKKPGLVNTSTEIKD